MSRSGKARSDQVRSVQVNVRPRSGKRQGKSGKGQVR